MFREVDDIEAGVFALAVHCRNLDDAAIQQPATSRLSPSHCVEVLLTPEEKQSALAVIGVEVRPLPALTGDKTKDGAAAINYVVSDAWQPIGTTLNAAYDQSHLALLEIALKSNLLLLVYAPDDQTGKTLAGLIERKAAEAGLPEAT